MSNSELKNNKIYSSILLILVFAISLIIGCTSEREIVNTNELIKISQPRVFANTFKNGLYKTNMQFHDRELSGLMFFNKKDSSLRLVMLSEVGLKYFDVEYVTGKKNIFITHQVIDFLNYDKFINTIQNFLRLVMINVNEQHQTYKGDESGFLIRQVSKDGMKTDYHYNSNSGEIDEITQNGSKKANIKLGEYDYLSPGSILYQQGKIHYSLVKVEKK